MGAVASDMAVVLGQCDSKVKMFNVICGIGGRDISPDDLENVFNRALEVGRTGVVKESVTYLGVRE